MLSENQHNSKCYYKYIFKKIYILINQLSTFHHYSHQIFWIIHSFSNAWIYIVVGVYKRLNKGQLHLFLNSLFFTNNWWGILFSRCEEKCGFNHHKVQIRYTVSRMEKEHKRGDWFYTGQHKIYPYKQNCHQNAWHLMNIWSPDVHHWLILEDFTHVHT